MHSRCIIPNAKQSNANAIHNVTANIYTCVHKTHTDDKTINTDVLACRRPYPDQCFQSHTTPHGVTIHNEIMESILDTNIFVLCYVIF